MIIWKPILSSRNIYKMKVKRKAAAATAVMTMMKETMTTAITLMNRQKGNKRLGVTGTVVLILIHKK